MPPVKLQQEVLPQGSAAVVARKMDLFIEDLDLGRARARTGGFNEFDLQVVVLVINGWVIPWADPDSQFQPLGCFSYAEQAARNPEPALGKSHAYLKGWSVQTAASRADGQGNTNERPEYQWDNHPYQPPVVTQDIHVACILSNMPGAKAYEYRARVLSIGAPHRA